jgi:hypothetical protein
MIHRDSSILTLLTLVKLDLLLLASIPSGTNRSAHAKKGANRIRNTEPSRVGSEHTVALSRYDPGSAHPVEREMHDNLAHDPYAHRNQHPAPWRCQNSSQKRRNRFCKSNTLASSFRQLRVQTVFFNTLSFNCFLRIHPSRSADLLFT